MDNTCPHTTMYVCTVYLRAHPLYGVLPLNSEATHRKTSASTLHIRLWVRVWLAHILGQPELLPSIKRIIIIIRIPIRCIASCRWMVGP